MEKGSKKRKPQGGRGHVKKTKIPRLISGDKQREMDIAVREPSLK